MENKGISVTLLVMYQADYQNAVSTVKEVGVQVFHLYSGSVSQFGVFLCFCYLLI